MRSIFVQDYSRWEIIIISDDKVDYQDVLARQGVTSDNIKYCSTGAVGSGAANARNVGLANACGDYIAVLDSDDAYHPARLSAMVPLVKKYGVAISNLQLIDEVTGAYLPNLSLMYEDEKLLPDQVFLRFFHAQSLIVFDKSVVTHAYAPLSRYEDNVFLMQIYNHVDVIGYLHNPYYHYYKYQGAATSFSSDGAVVSGAFSTTAQAIKDDVENGKIFFKSNELKNIMCDAMDCAVEAQAFFVNEINKGHPVKYHQVMHAFIQQWPLPASLR